jgi:hypothetical protein
VLCIQTSVLRRGYRLCSATSSSCSSPKGGAQAVNDAGDPTQCQTAKASVQQTRINSSSMSLPPRHKGRAQNQREPFGAHGKMAAHNVHLSHRKVLVKLGNDPNKVIRVELRIVVCLLWAPRLCGSRHTIGGLWCCGETTGTERKVHETPQAKRIHG